MRLSAFDQSLPKAFDSKTSYLIGAPHTGCDPEAWDAEPEVLVVEVPDAVVPEEEVAAVEDVPGLADWAGLAK
jgi:hypothetical protein